MNYYITKPAMIRLARRAGVKSISDDCYSVIHNLAGSILTDIITASIIVNSEHKNKTLMVEDLYEALELRGYNIARSTEINKSTCIK